MKTITLFLFAVILVGCAQNPIVSTSKNEGDIGMTPLPKSPALILVKKKPILFYLGTACGVSRVRIDSFGVIVK